MKSRNYIEYLLFKLAYSLLSLLPFGLLRRLCIIAAHIACSLGMRKRVVEVNLLTAFGETLSGKEITVMVRRCYEELGCTIAEIIKSESIVENSGEHSIHGLEILRREHDSGKGVMVLTAHLGNFLAGGYILGNMGIHLNVVGKPLHNPLLNEEFNKIREKYQNRLILISGARNDPAGGYRIFKTLKRGEIVVIVNDQDAGPDGYFGRFFGTQSSIPSGPARFAFRTGSTVTTGFAERHEGKVAMEIQEPIDYSQAGSDEEAEKIILDEYSRRLEEKVRRSPELYFWFHKKWKSTPEISRQYTS